MKYCLAAATPASGGPTSMSPPLTSSRREHLLGLCWPCWINQATGQMTAAKGTGATMAVAMADATCVAAAVPLADPTTSPECCHCSSFGALCLPLHCVSFWLLMGWRLAWPVARCSEPLSPSSVPPVRLCGGMFARRAPSARPAHYLCIILSLAPRMGQILRHGERVFHIV